MMKEDELKEYSFNVVPSPEDDRDYTLGMYELKSDKDIDGIPEEYISLKKIEIKNQGKSDMCMGFQMSYAKDIQEGIKTSPAWPFYFAHIVDPRPNKGGLIPRYALHALKKYGTVPLKDLNVVGKFDDIKRAITKLLKENPELREKAKELGIGSYARVNTKLEMKKAILEQDIIISGIPVYQGLLRAKQIIGLPRKGEEYEGGHAVGLIGWNKQGWILLNSWSKRWGMMGLSILPYDYPIWESWVLFDKEPDKKKGE